MCHLRSEIAKGNPQEDPADQGEQKDDRHRAPERSHPLLQKLPAVDGLTYSRTHESSFGSL